MGVLAFGNALFANYVFLQHATLFFFAQHVNNGLCRERVTKI